MTERQTRKFKMFLHNPEYRLTQRFEPKIEKTHLLKYFPKYYNVLETSLSKNDWPFISKLRQTKIVRHFRGEIGQGPIYGKVIHNSEEKIFKNKNKSVKSQPAWTYSNLKIEGKSRVSTFFPRIAFLDLTINNSMWRFDQEANIVYVDREKEQEILGPYNLFWKGLRHLKHLKLSNNTPYFWLIIREINSSPHFLVSLEKLEFSLIFHFDRKDNKSPRNVLVELFRNEQFLKYLTHFNCKDFQGFQYYDKLMSSILMQCPKLVSFAFPIGRQVYYFSSVDEIYKECQDTLVLSQLERIKNLQALNLSIFGFKTFAKYLSIPFSLQKITLNVYHSFYDPGFMDMLQGKGFFGRWKRLNQLQILQLELPLIRKTNDLLHKFILPLLESTTDLKEFECKFKDSPAHRGAWEGLNLSLFFSHLASLEKLKSVRISKSSNDEYSRYVSLINIMRFDPKKSKEIHCLSNLTQLEIDCPSLAKNDFQNSIKMFSRDDPPSKKKLKFSTLSFDSIDNFCEFLKFANYEAQSGDLEFDLAVHLWIKGLEQLFHDLKWPLVLERRVTVKLEISIKCAEMKKFMSLSGQEKKDLRKIFGENFDLSLAQLFPISYYYPDGYYERYNIAII